MTKKCRICGVEKDEEKFNDAKHGRDVCRQCRGQRERARMRVRMFNALGWCCVCCGETMPEFLSLDHIYGVDKDHRRGDGRPLDLAQAIRTAEQEGWPRDKYQILCMNCNFAKGHHEQCPHSLGVTAEMSVKRLCELAGVVVSRVYGPLNDAQKAGLALGPKAKHERRLASFSVKDAVKYRVMNDLGSLSLDELLKLKTSLGV